jgi:uncharacterized membrane protein YfcA
MPETLILALAAICTGVAAGLVSGLLGVGGGIIIVPVLEAVLDRLGFAPGHSMPIAVATSLATIVPTSIASARAHHRRGAVDLGLARRWAPAIMVGAIAGSLLAARVTPGVLTGLFGVVAAVMALRMLLPQGGRVLAPEVPRGAPIQLVPFVIGTVSSMMGIGGGTFSVPALTLMNQPVHRAVGTANLLGLAIALPGTIGYLLASTPPGAPPGTVGLVSLAGFLAIVPATVLAAPLGARLAHRLDSRRLSAAFGVFLSIVAARMLYRTMA